MKRAPAIKYCSDTTRTLIMMQTAVEADPQCVEAQLQVSGCASSLHASFQFARLLWKRACSAVPFLDKENNMSHFLSTLVRRMSSLLWRNVCSWPSGNQAWTLRCMKSEYIVPQPPNAKLSRFTLATANYLETYPGRSPTWRAWRGQG